MTQLLNPEPERSSSAAAVRRETNRGARRADDSSAAFSIIASTTRNGEKKQIPQISRRFFLDYPNGPKGEGRKEKTPLSPFQPEQRASQGEGRIPNATHVQQLLSFGGDMGIKISTLGQFAPGSGEEAGTLRAICPR
ncbi:MAG: hypothetical protein HYX37_01660 [Rhizobiales bacterium]|nr:hypothetical protein [Hyphomicrobiales bacterium]